LVQQVDPGTPVYEVPYPAGLAWKPFRIMFPTGVWLPAAAFASHRAVREFRPDAVLTSGPPHVIHLLGRHVRRRFGIPWVADFRDPWVAATQDDAGRGRRGWERRAEAGVMKEADAIVVNTPGALERLAIAYPRHSARMTSITNGYDVETFEIGSPQARPFSEPTIEVIHAGELYANRDPSPIFDAATGLDDKLLGGRKLRFRFIGRVDNSRIRCAIDERMRASSSMDIRLEAQAPYLEVIRHLMRADVLLLLDTPGRRAGVPAKLYEYIGAGRPILALAELDSDVALVLRESGAPHRVAPPLNPEAIRQALGELLTAAAHDPVWDDYRPDPRFSRKTLAGNLAELLDRCLEHTQAGRGGQLLPTARGSQHQHHWRTRPELGALE
jgi:glycosyltransferase involved in cell wall biosynthesis